MPNERNGRNHEVSDEDRQIWRPDDDDREARHWSERSHRMSERDDSDRRIEHYGQGQSGYGAGRYETDRSYGSRNQATRADGDSSRDRGGDERFSGGRGGQSWSPSDRDGSGSYGTSYSTQESNYGHPGRWDENRGGGYLGQSGQQMGYGQQRMRHGGRGVRGEGGMYGQGGYNEGMYGRGGQQDRFGPQGYQGYGSGQQSYGPQGPMHAQPGEHEEEFHGIGGDQRYQGVSGSGYGYQPEHDMGFRSGEYDFTDNEFSHDNMYGRTRRQHNYSSPREQAGMFGGEYGMYRERGRYGHQPRGPGMHRGKGPSGYTRSDDRIREMVCDVLTDHDEIDATNIEVAVKNGEVTLSGSIEDRRMKRLAEDVIEDLSGVKEVVNQLRVADRMAATSSSQTAVETSPREQSIQSGTDKPDKRHRA